ncbi:MAG TPA: phage tail assembly chaperone [Beijerinckiaceae bacterium]|jgi:hypothetical protein
MRLAGNEITITIGQETVRLRPSLRAALRLERRYDGLQRLLGAVSGGSLSAISDVIAETVVGTTDIPAFLNHQAEHGYRVGLAKATPGVVACVLALAGVDPDNPERQDGVAGADQITFSDYYERLFSIGTGWLGWTPDVTWSATPAEIEAAFKGRVDLLKAVFGGSDDGETKPDATALTMDDKVKVTMAMLGAKVVSRAA